MRYHSERSEDEGIKERKMWGRKIRRRKMSDRGMEKEYRSLRVLIFLSHIFLSFFFFLFFSPPFFSFFPSCL
jgi:hypothetical protein